ncbi:MAG: family 43 glycosylhydrolase [Sphaerochaetaceae bacterium]|nr:family 43 glycosylhydrolase [Sphaerochaetaceae bacterium]
MRYFCNPLNLNYRYQFNADPRLHGKLQICREAADPSLIAFKGRYYIFASMNLGVWVSDDLASWEYHRLPEDLPLYDYAPDVRVLGEYVYFCASKREENCDRYRTKDILAGPYEKIEGDFPYWDPNLFCDDDGRVYFYWGCSNATPIYGVELDRNTFKPINEKVALIEGHPEEIGYERVGDDNSISPASEEEVEAKFNAFVKNQGIPESMLPPHIKPLIRGMFSNRPYIEGAWMDKHDGRYYLQYAAPGTQYNTYSDGVYVSSSPLGPFTLAEGNPYSYKSSGFITGAGHGSTMEDTSGRLWHTSTMRISVNHDFERRIGLWRAGYDKDGVLFCNQNYGDWPLDTEAKDVWENPKWMLLSYKKNCCASSSAEGHGAENAFDENIRSWWKPLSSDKAENLVLDLESVFTVNAVQINFADDSISIPCPGEIRGGSQARYIEERELETCWVLEASEDGEHWSVIGERKGGTNLPHETLFFEDGLKARYLRLSGLSVPYSQIPCISGLRVFGLGSGKKPPVASFTVNRISDLDMEVSVAEQENTTGFNVLFGESEDKLYNSVMLFDSKKRIGALIKGRKYYVRVDSFNENGITKGEVHGIF